MKYTFIDCAIYRQIFSREIKCEWKYAGIESLLCSINFSENVWNA